jgi:hypothetical protein
MTTPLPGSGHDIEEIKRTAHVLEMVQMSAVAPVLREFSLPFSHFRISILESRQE